MKRIILIFSAIIALTINIQAQGLVASPSVISVAGDHVDTEGLSVTWTLGESVTTTLSNGGLIITQGFNQPKKDCVAIDPIFGCINANACNYDENANTDDGSCEFGMTDCPDPCNVVLGCTDPTALNFSADANCNDDTCEYEASFGSVSTTIYYDENDNGIFDGNDELLEGVTVLITFDDGNTIIITSDANGDVFAGDLPYGNYSATVFLPEGYEYGGGGTSTDFTFTINGDNVQATFGDNTGDDEIPVVLSNPTLNCENVFVNISNVCEDDSYSLYVSHFGAESFTVVNNLTDETIIGASGAVTIFGPYPYEFINDGASVTVTVTDNPECTYDVGFSQVACGSVSLELLSFDGSVMNNGNLIFWSTASEKEVDHYEIEKSYQTTDRFNSIGSINAHGNSNTTNNYQILDGNVESGVSYYRLIEVTTTGERVIASRVIALEKTNDDNGIVEVSPIPTTDILNVVFNSLEDYLTVYIYDVSGKLLKTKEVETLPGMNEFNMDIKDLPIGAYLMNIVEGANSETIRIIKN